MKKLIDVSQYQEELAFLPQLLEPMMKAVRDGLNKRIPKGWVILRIEEVPQEAGYWGNQIKVTTTLTVVKAPHIVTRLKLRIPNKYRRGNHTRNLVP
jgi:hypothetical protein